ncbi:MAG: CPBP family intramembrane metalloprotease [Kouleothrix sp.]|nr:CPBP family intramembrane metalloprotease [Kouleothrix sp.]
MAQYETPYTAAPEGPAPPRKWPLAGVMAIDFVITMIVWLALTFLVQIVFIALRMAQQGLPLSQLQKMAGDQAQMIRLIGADGLFFTLLATNAAFLLIPILRVKVIRREPLAEIGFQANRPLRLVLIGVGVGVLSLVLNAVLSSLFQTVGITPDQSAQFPLFRADYLGQALFLVGAAVLAPIGEEVLFRGYVFNAIRQTFGARRWGVALAYALSALLFAGVHSLEVSQGLVGLLVPLLVIGLLFAWAMHYTGSLIPAIIAHAINNGVALVALLTCINNPGITGCPKL